VGKWPPIECARPPLSCGCCLSSRSVVDKRRVVRAQVKPVLRWAGCLDPGRSCFFLLESSRLQHHVYLRKSRVEKRSATAIHEQKVEACATSLRSTEIESLCRGARVSGENTELGKPCWNNTRATTTEPACTLLPSSAKALCDPSHEITVATTLPAAPTKIVHTRVPHQRAKRASSGAGVPLYYTQQQTWL
jgi:hypothetical protein